MKTYHIEQEVRLLFNKPYMKGEGSETHMKEKPAYKRKWILDANYKIISPLVTFDITHK